LFEKIQIASTQETDHSTKQTTQYVANAVSMMIASTDEDGHPMARLTFGEKLVVSVRATHRRRRTAVVLSIS